MTNCIFNCVFAQAGKKQDSDFCGKEVDDKTEHVNLLRCSGQRRALEIHLLTTYCWAASKQQYTVDTRLQFNQTTLQ